MDNTQPQPQEQTQTSQYQQPVLTSYNNTPNTEQQANTYQQQASSSQTYVNNNNDQYQTLFPTKNKYSLISYYFGFLGLLPFIGLPFAILAIVFGIKALNKYKINPTPGAKGHAVTGIILASISLCGWVLFSLVMLAASLME